MTSFGRNQEQNGRESCIDTGNVAPVDKQEQENNDHIIEEGDHQLHDENHEAFSKEDVFDPNLLYSRRDTMDDHASNNDDDANDNIRDPNEKHPESDVAIGPRIRRALHFISHPSLVDISSCEKDSYLESKGYSKDEINSVNKYAAELMDLGGKESKKIHSNLDRAWDQSTPIDSVKLENRIEKHRQQPPNPQNALASFEQEEGQINQHHLPDLPSPVVPMTVGGALAVFGMAAFRWLNGGDFVLFPSFASTSHSNGIRQNNEGNDPHDVCEKDIDSNQDEIQFLTTRDVAPGCTAIDDTATLQRHQPQPQLQPQSEQIDTVNSVLSQDLQSLTAAIEKYTSIQVDAMKSKANEKARDKTDNAMMLLKEQLSRTSHAEKLKKDTDQDPPSHLQSSIQVNALVQIIEMKSTLETLVEKVNSISSMQHDEQPVMIHEILEKLNGIYDHIHIIKTHLLDEEENVNGDKCSLENGSNLQMLSNREVSKDEMANQTEIRDGLSNNGTSIDTSLVDKHEKESDDASCNKDVEQDGVSSFNRVGKEAMEDAIKNLKENNPPNVVKATCQMLLLYITNLEDNPTSERYQKIYTTSNKFKTLIANVPYAKEVLYALGFVEDGSFLKWTQLDKNECETSIMIQLLKEAKITLKLLNEEK